MESNQDNILENSDSKSPKQIKMVAFDLYWTLLNNISWLTKNFFKWKKMNKLSKDELLTTETNLDTLNIWKKQKETIRKQIEEVLIFPDVLETINYLKDHWYKIAIVSNLSSWFAEPLKKYIPEWLIDYKILSFEVWKRKPNPEIFEELKKQSWINFDETIMVWDSIKSDILWAQNVWIEPIYVNRKSEWIQYNDAYKTIQISKISDLIELVNMLKSWNISVS